MNPDEHHVALPKLYGAPAYARPPRVFEEIERPTDPDDLPLEAFRDDEGTTVATLTPPGPADGVPADEPGVVGDVTDAPPGDSAPPDPPGRYAEPVQDLSHTPQARPFSVRALSRFRQRR